MSVALAFALALAAGGVAAARRAGPPRRKQPSRRKPSAPRKPKHYQLGSHTRIAQVCELSQEQRKKVFDLRVGRDKALAAFRADSRAYLESIRAELDAARRSKDAEAIKHAQAEIARVQAEQAAIRARVEEAVMALLTPGQKDKWDTYNITNLLKARFRQFRFADEQKVRIKAVYRKLSVGLSMTRNCPERAAVLEKLRAHIQGKVITEAQRIDLILDPIMRVLRNTGLTDDQKAKLRAAYKKRKKEKGGKFNVFQELWDHVQKDILTADQRVTAGVNQLMWRYGRAKITPAQRTRMRAVYVEHTTGVDMFAWRARRAALDKVMDEIYSQVLTDEQRRVVKPRSKPPGRK